MYSFPLEERTEKFASDCRGLVKVIQKSIANLEDSKQLIRSSGSVAANYVEANESLSKKDFAYRVKICRKEAKESRLWLKLLEVNEGGTNDARNKLIGESSELIKIFSSMISKST